MSQPDQNKNDGWKENIRTVITAIILAVIVRSVAYEPFKIPSGSMKSNLLVGDYLFVSKFSYGYSRYSFPFGIPFFSGRILAGEPKRGDVVVFRLPPNPSIDYIKRVIGLPGDKVQVKEGILYINGNPLPRKFIDEFSDVNDYDIVQTIPRFKETLPEGKEITILKQKVGEYSANNTPIYTVPEGHYFMMGDNRDNSKDSRFGDADGFIHDPLGVGFVPAENLVGRAEVIWFSTDGSARFYNPVSWFQAMRFDRFFKKID